MGISPFPSLILNFREEILAFTIPIHTPQKHIHAIQTYILMELTSIHVSRTQIHDSLTHRYMKLSDNYNKLSLPDSVLTTILILLPPTYNKLSFTHHNLSLIHVPLTTFLIATLSIPITSKANLVAHNQNLMLSATLFIIKTGRNMQKLL